jgi:hypothetical protein
MQKEALFAQTLRERDLKNELLTRQAAEMDTQLRQKVSKIEELGNASILND